MPAMTMVGGLAGADGVGEKAATVTQDAGHRGSLVRVGHERGRQAGEGEMVAGVPGAT